MGHELARTSEGALADLGADPLAEVLAGQLSTHTMRAYRSDVAHLLLFLRGLREGHTLTGAEWRGRKVPDRGKLLASATADREEALRVLCEVTRAHLIAFRTYLRRDLGFSPASVNRRLAGVRVILRELHLRGLRSENPGEGVRGVRVGGEGSSTRGLSKTQAKALLRAPGGATLATVRDRAMLALMLRNGLRAAEVTALRVGDLGEDQGYRVATIRGKGEKARQAKLAGPTWEALKAWLDAANRGASGPAAAVFCPVRKYGRGDRQTWLAWERPLTTVSVAKVLTKYAVAALGEEAASALSPHSLRHTFATLALEQGASLRRTQYAMGHADPRTTERYDRARENLTDNAADYVTRALNG